MRSWDIAKNYPCRISILGTPIIGNCFCKSSLESNTKVIAVMFIKVVLSVTQVTFLVDLYYFLFCNGGIVGI